MTKKTICLAAFLAALICIAQPALAAGPNSVRWHSYAEGMALRKSMAKKVFINFYATWCGFCKRMDTKTFTDKAVIDYLEKNFIAVKVDVDKERNVAAQYNISPLPDTWFISETGDAIGNRPGFIGADDLLPVLKFIHTESYLKMSYVQFLESQK
ncbi:MAG: thioredoxin family protein [Deltaproteobacteria bacterium]|jgi:thioredoxin-related protein|nr:thioredoxin family protein [Deltaproteobacteria bacterium]